MRLLPTGLLLALAAPTAFAQVTTVPTDVQLPGTQPQEIATLETVGTCFSCHYGYDLQNEPGHTWSGSMMSHAARDPLYWATVAVAEQTFPGAGDLCIRCHSPRGWLDDRSTPTDGSALQVGDADAVSCHMCHMMVDPDEQQHDGFQLPPFVANDGGSPPEGWHGAGEYVMTPGFDRHGPYANASPPHGAVQSDFMRDPAMCGTCHDVSNPVVGDLAPSHGHPEGLLPGTFSGVLGSPVAGKAAFNNPPHGFGVIERTYSEFVASAFGTQRVGQYPSMPADLKRGIVEDIYQAATAGVPGGDFADGTPRFYTCQSCHMPPTVAKGAKQGSAPTRTDLARHDLAGGSVWINDAIQYLDNQGKLVLGGGLLPENLAAMADGRVHAQELLQSAAAVDVTGDTVRVTNLTGHKLISGYPEGRRMWLEVRWLGPGGELIDAVGEYGDLQVVHKGQPLTVETLLEPYDPDLRRYDVHMGLRQDWAAKLLGLGFPAGLPLEYDRLDGSAVHTLGDLAAAPAGTVYESLHFVLNDQVLSDTRIPPWGMDYLTARERGILPVPATQYGSPGPGGTFLHYDEFTLDPPVGAASAQLKLWYQSTSWEYVQFLDLAGTGAVAHLASTGADLLDAWLNTGMAMPELMTGATWSAVPGDCDHDGIQDSVEIAAGTQLDCDMNGIPDECEIAYHPSADLDGDGGLDVCQWLSAWAAQLSVTSGGSQGLALHAGPARGGDLHLVLGSVSGTSPGIPLGAFTLPLNVDGYLSFTLANANGPLLPGGFGFLDVNGEANAAVVVPPATSPALAGVVGHHAYVTLDPLTLAATGTSNPVSVTLVP